MILTFDKIYPDPKYPCVPFTAEQQKRVSDACDRWKFIWAMPEFRDEVCKRKFAGTNDDGITVYKNIMTANPKHRNFAITDTRHGKETAITHETEQITRLQSYWVSPGGASLNALTNTVAHEYTHTKEGGSYKHKHFQLFGSGPESVPVEVGTITETIADRLFPQDRQQG
jgi:hypothetical protein